MQAGSPAQLPGGLAGPARLDRLTLQPTPFSLGKAAPDAESLIVTERILKALGAHFAAAAHAFGFPRRAAFLGEECLRIGLRAQRTILPALLPSIICADA